MDVGILEAIAEVLVVTVAGIVVSVGGLLLLSRSRLGEAVARRIAGDSRNPACQEQLGGLCQILHNMEPVCALCSLGSAKCCGSRILPSTISTYHEKIWLLAHPGGCGFRFSMREKICVIGRERPTMP